MFAPYFWFQKSYRVTREHTYRPRMSLKDTEGVPEMRNTTKQMTTLMRELRAH